MDPEMSTSAVLPVQNLSLDTGTATASSSAVSFDAPGEGTERRDELNATKKPAELRRVVQLDFVRGIAILLVMEFHFLTVPVQNPVARGFEFFFKRIGWVGVDLFFVLSGFLVGGLLVQELLKAESIRIGRFLLRRMFKIWPAYYLYILFQIVVHKHPLESFAWQNILNIQNYAGTTLNHTWSLAVEEHFYLMLPLLLAGIYGVRQLRPWIPQILGAICFLVACGRIWVVYGLRASSSPQWKTHARVDSLLFGVLLSYLLYKHRGYFEKLSQQRLVLVLLSLAGLLFIFREGNGSRLMWSVGYSLNYISLGALLLLVYSYRGSLINTWPYRAVAWIGVYSYGIYLWHLSVREPLAKVVSSFPHSIQWGTLLFSQYAAAVVLGVLLTKAIELPMLRIRDHLIPRGVANPPPEQPIVPQLESRDPSWERASNFTRKVPTPS
jgi:peptidoglycan/LPS O-acetylase OafA/YrhL